MLSARPRPGKTLPSASCISTRILPPSNVSALSRSRLPCSTRGWVVNSPRSSAVSTCASLPALHRARAGTQTEALDSSKKSSQLEKKGANSYWGGISHKLILLRSSPLQYALSKCLWGQRRGQCPLIFF